MNLKSTENHGQIITKINLCCLKALGLEVIYAKEEEPSLSVDMERISWTESAALLTGRTL